MKETKQPKETPLDKTASKRSTRWGVARPISWTSDGLCCLAAHGSPDKVSLSLYIYIYIYTHTIHMM